MSAESIADINEAINIAEDFILRATLVRGDIIKVQKAKKEAATTQYPYNYRSLDWTLTASMKRRSMDLTRALAKLRRPL